MANDLKELLSRPLPRGDSTHATLLAVIGGYLIYMAYQMVRDTLSGASSMSLSLTLLLGGIMAVCGLAVIGYGIWMWRANVKAARKAQEQEDEV